MMRATLFLSAACAAITFAMEARAQCGSQAACPTPCESCRVPSASGMNPAVADMARLFDRIASGPRTYGSLGWNFGGRDTIGAGAGCCDSSTATACTSVAVTFPCLLLKAIYLTESNWRQFCTTNRTVIAFDCGYGIAQVTSGMRRGDTSAYDANRVASDPAYNVSVGAAILADKWRASACVGSNNPGTIEHWYFATWGYNGFAVKNNPNNPMYRADRAEYRTPGNAAAQTRGNYPYQEIVWGYAHYPLSAAHYTGLGLAYPRKSEICASCGFPMANISDPPGSHPATCNPAPPTPDAGAPDVIAPRDVMTEPDVAIAPDVAMVPDVMAAPDVVMADAAVDVVVARDARRSDAGDEPTNPSGCGCTVATAAHLGNGALAATSAAMMLAQWKRRRRRRV